MSQEPSSPENTPAVSAVASHRLYQGGIVALIGALIYCYWITGAAIDFAQYLTLGTIIFSSLPALFWAKQRRTWFPAFEISMLTCIAFYAIPLFKGTEELSGFTSTHRTEAALVVLLYTACANFGFANVRNPVQPSSWAIVSLLPTNAIKWIPIGVFLNVIYAYVSLFTKSIPHDIEGTLRALSFGIGIMSTFILARLWGLGQLKREQVAYFIISLVLYLILTFASLYLIGGISLLALTFISYASARRQVPWIALALGGTLIAMLHLGKPTMRSLYWDPITKESRSISLSSLPDFYTEWFGYSMQAAQHPGEDGDERPSSIFQRASLIQMVCLSVAEVPSTKPYLMGESYVDIPAQVIPRFLWQNKPSSLLANIRLAVYFNLVAEDSGFSVSIAFGPLAEAYVNFGYFGVALLGLLMGAGFKRIAMLSDGAPQFSALGIFMILLTAWSFQAEQVMATWLSSLFQACVICIGLPVIYRRLSVG